MVSGLLSSALFSLLTALWLALLYLPGPMASLMSIGLLLVGLVLVARYTASLWRRYLVRFRSSVVAPQQSLQEPLKVPVHAASTTAPTHSPEVDDDDSTSSSMSARGGGSVPSLGRNESFCVESSPAAGCPLDFMAGSFSDADPSCLTDTLDHLEHRNMEVSVDMDMYSLENVPSVMNYLLDSPHLAPWTPLEEDAFLLHHQQQQWWSEVVHDAMDTNMSWNVDMDVDMEWFAQQHEQQQQQTFDAIQSMAMPEVFEEQKYCISIRSTSPVAAAAVAAAAAPYDAAFFDDVAFREPDVGFDDTMYDPFLPMHRPHQDPPPDHYQDDDDDHRQNQPPPFFFRLFGVADMSELEPAGFGDVFIEIE
jgi:hypothetical protein